MANTFSNNEHTQSMNAALKILINADLYFVVKLSHQSVTIKQVCYDGITPNLCFKKRYSN